ncbi:MAG TPA: SRPBCC domain-containing protein [Solirubrobacteraceae bacterium]|nr:SRPBCC domain-containing protein [Solirubrobacteraceae bacterium]
MSTHASTPATPATAESPTSLRLQRTFDASPQEVFDAWTHPELLRRWWAADPSWPTAVAEVDLRPGGRYLLSMEDPSTGATHTVSGEYREIDPPNRLLYTWQWELDDGGWGHESTVAVHFLPDDSRTTVVLEHTGLESPDSRDRHRSGWEGCLESFRLRALSND